MAFQPNKMVLQMQRLLAVILLCLSSASAAERPNILLIMADDLGIEGLGCYGGTSYRTPNLDRMASEGMKFTHAFAQPLCTPTRVQLMTGRYNHRNWKAFGILDPKETTMAAHLQASGYATAIFGKWQLQSYDPPDFPNSDQRRDKGMQLKDAGFDEYAVFHGRRTEDKGSRYANPKLLSRSANEPEETKTYLGSYGEDIWVNHIIDFMDRHKDQPAFCYYPMALPHKPFEPTPRSSDWNPDNVPAQDVKYIVDMVEYIDTVLGRLMKSLGNRGLLENTLVLFYSDNGFHQSVSSSLSDGRTVAGGKALPLQTGIHVPLIAYWKDRIQPGITNGIVDASDFVPTLLEVGQAEPIDDRPLDGHSFLNTLLGKPGHQRDAAFFWYDPRPGWDKERFDRSVFAVDHDHKRFRDGRLFRLSDRPLEETLILSSEMTTADHDASRRLENLINEKMTGSVEPPLVDAFGAPIVTNRPPK
ncbi:MAG: sulfatase-like hydrolase/transferase [Fuerstiella sp.]